MKLLLDENLSPRLVEPLAAEFPGSVHVERALGRGRADADVWQHAVAQGCVGNASTPQILELLQSKLAEAKAFGESPRESLLVLEL